MRAGVSPLIEYNKTKSIGEACDIDTAVVNYLDNIAVVAAQWAYYTTGAVFQYNEASDTRMLEGTVSPGTSTLKCMTASTSTITAIIIRAARCSL